MCVLELQENSIEVSKGKKLYCMLQHECYVARKMAQDAFMEDYKKCGNLKNLIDHLFEIVYKMEDSAEDMIYNLVDKYTGIIWVLDDGTAKKLSKYTKDLFDPVWKEIVVKRAELLEYKENMQEYRRIRKETRRRDGSDVLGWTLHTTRNAIGNAGTSFSTSMAEMDIFNNKEMQAQLLELVRKTYYAYQKAMYNYLEENEEIEFEQIGREGVLKAQKFLEKAKTYPINSSENISFLKNAIEHCPDIQEIYEYITENYGDSDLKVEKFALEFMVDISGWKKDKVEDLLEKSKVTDLSSESKILAAIDAAENTCQYFGVQADKFDYVKGLKQTWEKIDKILRTVEGVEYSSREKANDVKADIRCLENYSIEKDMLFSVQTDEEKELLISRLKSEAIRETLNDRLLKLRSCQDILNIQTASREIIQTIPAYEKNQKNFLFGHIFSQKKSFERFRGILANNEKIAFVYDTAWMNKGKNGLLLTNKKLYYYTEKDVSAVNLEEFAGIEISQEKIRIIRKENEDLGTDLKANVDQLEYGLFCETFEHIVMMCRAIKNGDQEAPDQKVYDNYQEKVPGLWPADKKKIVIPVAVVMALLAVILIIKSFSGKQVEQEADLSEGMIEQPEIISEEKEEMETDQSSVMEIMDDETIIEQIRNSSPSAYMGEVTYGEAFERFFSTPEWSSRKNESGKTEVVFTGTCLFQEQSAEVEIVFEYNDFTNEAFVSGFRINNETYSADYWGDLQQAVFVANDEAINSTPAEEETIDYASWADSYLRINGPSATIFIWDANAEGIQFAAGIGASGAMAYIDMRDLFAEWIDTSTAFYTDGMGYELTLTMLTDGKLDIYENRTYYEDGLSLAGTYTRESESDLSTCEYVFPSSDVSILSLDDCTNMNELECKIARNEIYARHGRRFNDESLQAYFDVCSWYNGTTEAEDFTQDMLSEVELANLQTINEYESMMGYRD